MNVRAIAILLIQLSTKFHHRMLSLMERVGYYRRVLMFVGFSEPVARQMAQACAEVTRSDIDELGRVLEEWARSATVWDPRLDQLRSAIERILLEGLTEFSKRIAVV